MALSVDERDPRIMSDLTHLMRMKDLGYEHVRPLARGRWAGLMRFMFTYAIIVGRMGDEVGYENRWCYKTYAAALMALETWDGVGEPEGWHRHPDTGRRRENGDPDTEYVNP